jgi:hypothetical protein
MTKTLRASFSDVANQQAAAALLAATFAFLRRNNISKKLIVDSARQNLSAQKLNGRVSQYRKSIQAYEDMGMIMSAWFSVPRFLDTESRPLPLTEAAGPRSVARLVRASHVKISATLAVELMRQSSSVRIDSQGNFIALKRVFVLPYFEVPRAALVVERFLDTLRQNSSAHRNGTTLLLERNCHVPQMDFDRIVPILRDIKSRGTAFMDSVDGDIEARRIRRHGKKRVGELGVLVFAWTQPKARRSKSNGYTKY